MAIFNACSWLVIKRNDVQILISTFKALIICQLFLQMTGIQVNNSISIIFSSFSIHKLLFQYFWHFMPYFCHKAYHLTYMNSTGPAARLQYLMILLQKHVLVYTGTRGNSSAVDKPAAATQRPDPLLELTRSEVWVGKRGAGQRKKHLLEPTNITSGQNHTHTHITTHRSARHGKRQGVT